MVFCLCFLFSLSQIGAKISPTLFSFQQSYQILLGTAMDTADMRVFNQSRDAHESQLIRGVHDLYWSFGPSKTVCFDLGFQIINPVIEYHPDPSCMSCMEAHAEMSWENNSQSPFPGLKGLLITCICNWPFSPRGIRIRKAPMRSIDALPIEPNIFAQREVFVC